MEYEYELLWQYEDRLNELEQEKKINDLNLHKMENIEDTHGKENVWLSSMDSRPYLEGVKELLNQHIHHIKQQIKEVKAQ